MLLLMILFSSSLAACGEQSKEEGAAAEKSETTLTVSWWGNQIRNERTQQVLDMYAEQNEGIRFDGQFNEWNDYWQKLATASAGKSLPDVIQMDYQYLDQYVKNDLLVDLTPYVEDGTLHLDDASELIIDSGKVDGKLYSVPIGINAPAFLYNKAITDAAGVTIKDNMTLEEYLAVSKTIYEKTGYKTNLVYGQGKGVGLEIIASLVRADGGKILFDGSGIGVESGKEFEPFFEVYEQGMQEGWMIQPEVFAELTVGSVEQDPLVYGSGPEVMTWSSFIWSNQYVAYLNVAPEGSDLQMTTWPSANAKLANYLKPSQLFSVSKDSKNPQEAVKVIDFWTNSVEANEILLGERGVPISTAVAEGIAPQLSDPEKEIIRYVNEVVAPNSSPINPPSPEGSAEVSDIINQLVEQVTHGQITAAEAAGRLYTEGKRIMEEGIE